MRPYSDNEGLYNGRDQRQIQFEGKCLKEKMTIFCFSLIFWDVFSSRLKNGCVNRLKRTKRNSGSIDFGKKTKFELRWFSKVFKLKIKNQLQRFVKTSSFGFYEKKRGKRKSKDKNFETDLELAVSEATI